MSRFPLPASKQPAPPPPADAPPSPNHSPAATDQARLAALYEVSRLLGASLNVDEVLRIVIDSAIRLTSAERGFLMLLDEKTGQLVFRIARNAAEDDLEEKMFEVSRTVISEIARSGQPVVTTNAQSDPRFATKESVVLYALRSIMAVPLIVREKVIGVLYVDNKAKNALFVKNDLTLLNTFAGQASVSIENARLYTRTNQALAARVTELESMQAIDRQLNAILDFEAVMKMTLELALKQAEGESGWIGIIETEPDAPPCVRVVVGRGTEPGVAFPCDHPHLAQALETGEPQRPMPAPGENAVLVAPVVREGKAIAAIVLERPELLFTDAAEAFVARLADHAAIAIENARLYRQVKRANEAKSQFVSVVSHELKSPMTSINGSAEILRRQARGPLNEDQLKLIDIIRSGVERMAVLVNDLSDISRIENGLLKMDIGEHVVSVLVQEALTGLATQIEAKEQTLALHLPPHLPKVHADKARLIQVIINLVSNAHKYSPPGGAITISAVFVPHGMILPKERRGMDAIRFSVTDTGVGIAPEEQARLFSQFFRSDNPAVREQPGWGLGLHITRRLVELLGGEITVQSAGIPGKGSTFSFTIPAQA